MSPAAATDSAVHALLENLIDYAGLFPPARLDMQPVVDHYARILDSDDAWMLERLVVPVDRLAEFERCAAELLPTGEQDEPWPLSVLVAAAGDPRLERDLEAVVAFNGRHCDPARGLAIIDVIELPGTDADAVDAALDLVPDELFPFFELDWRTDVRGLLTTLVGGDAGAKIRTGGVEPDAIPPIGRVAAFIEACAGCDVPFKATAGLHHPLRGRALSVEHPDVVMHGFLNVFVAGLLATHHGVEADGLEPILAAETLEPFVLTADEVGFGELTCTRDEVEDARLGFCISFGSCSFDEPREDLRSLGLL